MAAVEDESSTESKKYKVIIIGGGTAGISAASHLIKNGMDDFLLLEAKSQLGGRIASTESCNNKFELGANWIHGVLGNPMYEIAVANGLVSIVQSPKPHKVVAATEDGKQVPFQTLQEIYEAYMCFLHRCEEYFLCQYLPPEGIESVGEHIELEINLYLKTILDPAERRLKRLLFDCLLRRETCITGCNSMTEIDLLELGSYVELQGGNIALPSGYSSILEPMCRDIPKELIVTDCAVCKVKWDSGWGESLSTDTDSDTSERTVIGSETVKASKAKPPENEAEPSECEHKDQERKTSIQVICENGEVFHCSHVICTVPLGILKTQCDSLFSPHLPEYKKDSISRLLFGTVNKIFLIYERPFLNPDVSEVLLVWNEDPDNSEDVTKVWFKKIYSFTRVNDNILLGWLSGKEAEYSETLSDEQIVDQCTLVLRKFLCDPYIPKPKGCVRTHWKSDRFTRGSYTAIAVGASQYDIENIAQPLYSSDSSDKPTVLFAGEHTHSSFYSTVHGAYLTGRTCAQTILDAYLPEESHAQLPVEQAQSTDLSAWIQGLSLDES